LKAVTIVGIGGVALIAGATLVGFSAHRRAMIEAEAAYRRVAARPGPPPKLFEPQQVAHLPEIARRYFGHAIAPGTPLYSVAELEMEGVFLLGDAERFQAYAMSARQALRPPDQFVWVPKMRSGAITITGSDALVQGDTWTRFWLLKLFPVAQESTSPDLVRSASFRAAIEGALWLPTSLLPGNGVEWEQVGPNEARVTLRRFQPEIILQMKMNDAGSVTEVVGQRWSNANRHKAFRLQPFGGTFSAERTFQGLTIPTGVAAGNHYGTKDYLPFFQVTVTRAAYK
jgi:hypothetical protein